MRFKISTLINSFGVIVAVGALAVALIGAGIANQIRIGGALYNEIKDGNDLVADILPPPEYVIEGYLEATLALNKSKPLADSKARLTQLHKDYDDRRAYWQKSELPPALVEKLTKKSDAQVQIFWHSVEDQLLPALQRGDRVAAEAAYATATKAYTAHRAVIDEVVNDANALNDTLESEAEARGRTALVTAALVVGGLLLFLIVGIVFINRRAVKPMTKITNVMSEISSGNTDRDVPGAERRDEIGEMAKSVLVFRDTLVRVKAMEAERAELDRRAAKEREAALQKVADEFEAAVGGVVQAAIDGDFSQRIDLAGKTGMVFNLGTALNRLCENVSAALDDFISMLDALSGGDLTKRITAAYSGNFAALKDNANATAEHIGSTIAEIKAAARELSSAAAEIASSTTDLSQRTEEQAASLEETSASMEQISSTVKKNAENAQAANTSANSTREVADRGGEVVGKAVSAMARINEASHKISEIISVIDEIARQTNLLALNAAVEAARAGDAGRGFAVVASEVRSLAQRSSQAAKDIKELIGSSNEQVKDGVDLVDRSGSALTEIAASIKEVAAIIAEIAHASGEQADGIEQINKALVQMDEVTQQNSALVEENAATAKTLEHQARAMDERVAYFRLPQTFGGGELAQTSPRNLHQTRAATSGPSKNLRVVRGAA
jgi:methyl-accepting chemotaxis protein